MELRVPENAKINACILQGSVAIIIMSYVQFIEVYRG